MEDKKIFYEKDVIDFAETKIIHFSGEEYLGEKIIMYNQVHLAVSYKGDLENYLGIAKLKLAEKALEKGCVMVVDSHYFKDDVNNGSVIFVATGLRSYEKANKIKSNHSNINNKKIRRDIFAEEHMTHISSKNFLERILSDIKNYKPIEMYVYHKGRSDEDYLHQAELALAGSVIKQNYSFVTQMDYTEHDPEKAIVSIVATGLKRY
jgi:hypothetical protein